MGRWADLATIVSNQYAETLPISDAGLLFYNNWKYYSNAGGSTNAVCNWATGDYLSTNRAIPTGYDDSGNRYLAFTNNSSPNGVHLSQNIGAELYDSDFFIAIKYKPLINSSSFEERRLLQCYDTVHVGLHVSLVGSEYVQAPRFRCRDASGTIYTIYYMLNGDTGQTDESYTSNWHTVIWSMDRNGTNSLLYGYFDGVLCNYTELPTDYSYTSDMNTNYPVGLGCYPTTACTNNIAMALISEVAIGKRVMTEPEAAAFHRGNGFKNTYYVAE